MLLADRMEEWWGSVMDVGLDPELTKWSVRLGPVIVLTGKGYKEHHWLVIPHQPLRLSPIHFTTTQCLPLPVPSPALRTSSESAVVPSESAVKLAPVPMPIGPSPPLCLMKKVTK